MVNASIESSLHMAVHSIVVLKVGVARVVCGDWDGRWKLVLDVSGTGIQRVEIVIERRAWNSEFELLTVKRKVF